MHLYICAILHLRMTIEKIHQIYKMMALVLGLICIVILLVPFGDYAFLDRLGLVFTLNIGYHIFYYAISLGPLTQLDWIKHRPVQRETTRRSLLMFSYFVMAGVIFASYSIVSETFVTRDYYNIFGLFAFKGAVLGALRLNIHLNDMGKH